MRVLCVHVAVCLGSLNYSLRPCLQPPVGASEEVERSEDAEEQLHNAQARRRDPKPLLQDAAVRLIRR